MSILHANSVICQTCDQLLQLPEIQTDHRAFCPRCDSLLTSFSGDSLQQGIAFSIAALILLVSTYYFPILDLSVQGQSRTLSLIQSATSLLDRGDIVLGSLVMIFVVIAPTITLLAVITLFTGLELKIKHGAWYWLTRGFYFLKDWNMIEVYLVGLFVTLTKMNALAEIELGLAFWSLILFSFFFLAAIYSVDRHQIWLSVKKLAIQ